MTKINKIVMQGFKSFAKHTEIPFGPGFNVVLGPNGSGKSNVTDAICFVLGKLSAKGLRAEKQANLIYDGHKSNKPAKFAKVSIYFDNSNRVFPYDTNEVEVSRKVLPTGNSIYKINGQTCSRKEVLDLLSLAKITPEGYNIILQGDIDKFIEMSAENRRQLIEEIADITVYEEKKHQALLELNKVEEKLKEAKIVLAERKTYLDELKEEHDQALRYKEMTERIDQHKATYLHLQIT
ncbi:chromosome segregation protein SMC, partial [Candidatus Woesearchaeota archaeon]